MDHEHTHPSPAPDEHAHHMATEQQEHSEHVHSKHEGHSIEQFKKRFFVSLVFTIPILALTPLIQGFIGLSFTIPGQLLIQALLASIIFFYGGYPFLIGAFREIRDKAIGMMTLISLAITVAYGYSMAVVFGFPGEGFFWELATLIDIMLLGHWIEMKSVMGASQALQKLAALIPDKAHVLRDGNLVDVDTTQLADNDIVVVKPGEKIPTDGLVVRGSSFVNESMLTGEAKPVAKEKGSKVIGGSLNDDGSLEIQVLGVGKNSYLSKVIQLVSEAQQSKSKTQALADKAAYWLTIIAIVAGTVTFVSWIIATGDVAFAVERTATVLVIACPHALGLAVPLVAAISTTLSAQNGLLIRNRTAFENARSITTVVLDKTGTLTVGTFTVSNIVPVQREYTADQVLQLAASLDRNSEHPVGKAIVATAQNKKLPLLTVQNFKSIKGRGVQGNIKGKKILAISQGYARELGITSDSTIPDQEGTLVYVVEQSSKPILLGIVSLSDIIREDSPETITKLHQEDIKTWMLTGDNENTARAVATKLQLQGYFANVLPDQKQLKVKELQSQGEYVAMVGDGINDAPALAQADVGIAIGSGTDVAAETADIILINSSPKDILALIRFGKATYAKMIQNLLWATGYNVFAIPLAAGVLAPYNVLLSPALGAVLMSLSTIIVAVNARLLKIED